MELLCILKNKKFLAFFAVVLVLNGALFFVSQQRTVENNGVSLERYRQIIAQEIASFSDDAILVQNQKYSRLLSFLQFDETKADAPPEILDMLVQEQASLAEEDPELYRAYTQGEYDDGIIYVLSEFYAYFSAQVEHRAGYADYINAIVAHGEEMAGFKLFADSDSYSNRAIRRTVADFQANRDLSLRLVNDRGISAVLNDQIGDILLLLIGLFTVLCFTGFEKSFCELLFASRNGRAALTLRRLPLLFGSVLVGAVCIYGTQLGIAQAVYVLPIDFQAPVQSSDWFANCIYPLNFGQFLLLFVPFKALVCTALALLFWLLCAAVQNTALPATIFGGVVAVEFVLYQNISAQSTLSFLKTFNIFTPFDNAYILTYRLFSLFGRPVRTDVWLLVAFVLVAMVCAALLIWCTARAYPVRSPGRSMQRFTAAAGRLHWAYAAVQSAFYGTRLESYKLLHVGRGLLVFLVLFVVLYAGFNTNKPAFSPAESYLNMFYEVNGGPVQPKTYEALDALRAELSAQDAELAAAESAYAAGDLCLEDYMVARQKNELFAPRREALAQLETQLARLEEVRDAGIEPVLLNEKGYTTLFDWQADQTEVLLCLCGVILLATSLFPIEKSSGMEVLTHCALRGRGRVFGRKLATLLPSSLVICVAVYGVQIGQIAYLYGLPSLSAGVQNLSLLQDVPLAVPIWGYLLLGVLFSFLTTVCTGVVCAVVSQFLPQSAAAVIGLFIFVLPSLLYMLGFSSMEPLAAVYSFNWNALLTASGDTALCFAPVLLLGLSAVCCGVLGLHHWCCTKEG